MARLDVACRSVRHVLVRVPCRYVDIKWPAAAGKYRKSIAEALTSATVAVLPESGRPPGTQLRSALVNWAFNTRLRSGPLPDDVAADLSWVSTNSPAVGVFGDPAVLRSVLDLIATKLDGGRAAATVVNRKRAVLSNALSYAVELNLLASNLIGSITWTAPKSSGGVVDRRCVPNPQQAKAFLDAVRVTPRSGLRLHAFFACLYYSALRPEEAVNLRLWNLDLPEVGWGWITLEKAAPDGSSAANVVVNWPRSPTCVSGSAPERRFSARMRPLVRRRLAVPTIPATRPSPRGWPAAATPPRSLSVRGTASMSCSRSTPRFSTVVRRRRCAGSRPPSGRPAMTTDRAPLQVVTDVR